MFNSIGVRCNPRLHVLFKLKKLYVHLVARVRRRRERSRRAYVSETNIASHDNYEKINSLLLFFLSVLSMLHRLATPPLRRSTINLTLNAL